MIIINNKTKNINKFRETWYLYYLTEFMENKLLGSIIYYILINIIIYYFKYLSTITFFIQSILNKILYISN